MPVSFKHDICGNGITISRISDGKFKSNSIVIRFITPIDSSQAAKNSLLVDLLATSNSNYPSRELLTEKMAEMYGSSIGSFCYKVADYQICGLSISFIGDNYTIDNDKISTQAAQIILDCILKPDFENGYFKENYFEIRKNQLLDDFKNSINNKRSYAFNRAGLTIFENEPASTYILGDLENAEKITQDDLLDTYKRLLSQAAIDITICGDGNTADAETLLVDKFSAIDRKYDGKLNFSSPSKIKFQPKYIEEKLDIAQCKMFMALKTDNADVYIDKVMCTLLGGSPTSKLFMNVREKLSLCYYCSSAIIEGKSTIIIDSGVDEDKISITQTEVLNQLEEIKNGNFTDDEIANIKLFLADGFRSNYDTVSDMNSWYFYQFVRGASLSPNEVIEKIEKITREDVINSAKGYKLDTVYTLKTSDGGDE